jgi:hypothetical protein
MMSRGHLVLGTASLVLFLVGCSPQFDGSTSDELASGYTDLGSIGDELIPGYADLGTFGSAARQIDYTFNLEFDLAEWQQVRDLNCDGARSTVFEGYYMPASATALSQDLQTRVSERAWAAALTLSCPDVLDDWVWTAEDEQLFANSDPSWQSQLETDVPNLYPVQPPDEYYNENYGDRDWEMGIDGDGYAVQCADGEISLSGGKQGACSGHGGID